jgi:hypothetical protein
MFARHQILYIIADQVGWGYTPLGTKGEKDWAYQCQREKLVWSRAGLSVPVVFYTRRPYGSERIANWWCITLRGFLLMMKDYNSPKINEMKLQLFNSLFGDSISAGNFRKDIFNRPCIKKEYSWK